MVIPNAKNAPVKARAVHDQSSLKNKDIDDVTAVPTLRLEGRGFLENLAHVGEPNSLAGGQLGAGQ